MLTPQSIMDQLACMVGEKFPGEKVYQNLTPRNFDRPGTLIEQIESDCSVSFSTGGIELRPVFRLTTFVPVDEYHHSHLAELHRRQMALVALFLPGYVQVGDRAPKVMDPLKLDGGYDFDTVTVKFSYTLSRHEFMELTQAPTMEHLRIREEVRTYE